MFYILNNDKEPVQATFEEWCAWLHRDDRQIARDTNGTFVVSTVFVGIRMQTACSQLFETLVTHGSTAQSAFRTSTYKDAKACHAEVLRSLTCEGDTNE